MRAALALSSLLIGTILAVAPGCERRGTPVAVAAPPTGAPPAPPPTKDASAAEATPEVLAAKAPTTGLTLPPARAAGSCKSVNGLPDRNCTPGVIDPRVTQANVQTTICRSGYTDTVRPPTSYTDKLKVQQITEYGYSDTDVKDYEEDHLISLEIGGNPTDPRNLWPELGPSPNPKDKIENELHKKVCSGAMTLAVAQQQISTNWKAIK